MVDVNFLTANVIVYSCKAIICLLGLFFFNNIITTSAKNFIKFAIRNEYEHSKNTAKGCNGADYCRRLFIMRLT